MVILALNPTSAGTGSVASGDSTHDASSETDSAHDVERGRELYVQNCAACHGPNGAGGTGKSLKNLASRQSFETTVQWLENPKPPMPKLFPSPLGEHAIRNIAAFIRTF
jgi:ubiquinol-cytochrome c reductase cytochrome c subunit